MRPNRVVFAYSRALTGTFPRGGSAGLLLKALLFSNGSNNNRILSSLACQRKRRAFPLQPSIIASISGLGLSLLPQRRVPNGVIICVPNRRAIAIGHSPRCEERGCDWSRGLLFPPIHSPDSADRCCGHRRGTEQKILFVGGGAGAGHLATRGAEQRSFSGFALAHPIAVIFSIVVIAGGRGVQVDVGVPFIVALRLVELGAGHVIEKRIAGAAVYNNPLIISATRPWRLLFFLLVLVAPPPSLRCLLNKRAAELFRRAVVRIGRRR